MRKYDWSSDVCSSDLDGEFPGHHPDPTLPETLEQLRREVHRRHCDLGIAFDGDGDRIGVIDDSGDILWGDQLMMLWAEDVLRAHPGATVIADVKTSRSEEHTSELQSLMRTSYAVFCLKKKQ